MANYDGWYSVAVYFFSQCKYQAESYHELYHFLNLVFVMKMLNTSRRSVVSYALNIISGFWWSQLFTKWNNHVQIVRIYVSMYVCQQFRLDFPKLCRQIYLRLAAVIAITRNIYLSLVSAMLCWVALLVHNYISF